jgi:uncharacterized protein (TIGR03000 family)
MGGGIHGGTPGVMGGPLTGILTTPPSEIASAPAKRVANATLVVTVPEDAVVFINGKATQTRGALRKYFSKGLEQGETYRYTIRAQVIRGGATVEDTRVARVCAGETKSVTLDFSRRSDAELIASR